MMHHRHYTGSHHLLLRIHPPILPTIHPFQLLPVIIIISQKRSKSWHKKQHIIRSLSWEKEDSISSFIPSLLQKSCIIPLNSFFSFALWSMAITLLHNATTWTCIYTLMIMMEHCREVNECKFFLLFPVVVLILTLQCVKKERKNVSSWKLEGMKENKREDFLGSTFYASAFSLWKNTETGMCFQLWRISGRRWRWLWR